MYVANLHRDQDGVLGHHPISRLECTVKYRITMPIEEERLNCPYILITSRGVHEHPIPLPEKTPKLIRTEIMTLLETLREDLPDLTARGLLRHPSLKTYLYARLPDIRHPTLSHLHPSLANRAHLSAYIALAKKEHFPCGTDWKGLFRFWFPLIC